MEKKTIQKWNKQYPLIISDKLEKKIRVLCNKFPSTEWSGILFYSCKGSFQDDSMEFTAEDLLFMDTGGSVTTEFYLDEANIGSYIIDHDLFGCQCGLIHSHHSMSAYFSGQDTEMLNQEGKSRNHFLSLVVNNSGKYVACVTLKSTTTYEIKSNLKFLSYNNEEIQIEEKEEQEEECIYKCDLNIYKNNTLICDDYDELMETIANCEVIKKEREEREKREKENKNISSFERKVFFEPEITFPEFYKEGTLPFCSNNEFFDYTDYNSVNGVLTQKEVECYAGQLLSLSLLVNNDKEAQVFLNNMENIFNERFSTIEEYNESLEVIYSYVIENILWEYLCSKIEAEKVIGIDIEEEFKNAKYQIINKLTEYKSNKYIETIIKMLA